MSLKPNPKAAVADSRKETLEVAAEAAATTKAAVVVATRKVASIAAAVVDITEIINPSHRSHLNPLKREDFFLCLEQPVVLMISIYPKYSGIRTNYPLKKMRDYIITIN